MQLHHCFLGQLCHEFFPIALALHKGKIQSSLRGRGWRLVVEIWRQLDCQMAYLVATKICAMKESTWQNFQYNHLYIMSWKLKFDAYISLVIYIFFLFFFFLTESHCVAQAVFKLQIFLPLSPECWNYRCLLPCLKKYNIFPNLWIILDIFDIPWKFFVFFIFKKHAISSLF